MKRFICFLAAAAALLVTASCVKDKEKDIPDYLLGGTPVDVTFGVNTGTGLLTKAIADGTTAVKLQAAWYEVGDNGVTYCASKDAVISDLSAEIVLSLAKGKTYKVVFWAAPVEGSPYTVDFPNKTVTAATAVTANDEKNDVFYKVVEYTVEAQNEVQDVVLTRPVAQIAVVSPKEDINGSEIALENTGITVAAAYTKMDLLTGVCSEPKEVTFANAPIDYADEIAPKANYYYVAVGYVLAGDGNLSNISFNANGLQDLTYQVENASLKRNWRTVIAGNILPMDGSDADVDWVVTVDPSFGGETESDVNVVEPTVTFVEPGEQESVVPAPYVEEAGDDNESMDLDSDTPSMSFPVISNSEAPVTVSSNAPAVATAEIDAENQVTVTAVGNGEALITIHQDATGGDSNGIKTRGPETEEVHYAAYDYTFLVTVTGMGDTPQPPVNTDAVYTLVTDASDLQDGDELLILNLTGTYAMGAQNSNNYREIVSVEVQDDAVMNPDDDIQIVTLEGTEGAWNLSVGDGYLAAGNTAKNILVVESSVSTLSTWTIDIENDGTATVKATSGERNQLCFNGTSNALRFSCYKPSSLSSSITEVALYRRAADLSPDLILEQSEIGCYLGSKVRKYVSGTDQYIREYDGNVLNFVLVDPAKNEQVEISGYDKTLGAGQAVSLQLDWRKGTSLILSKSYSVTVVKVEDRKVWLGDVKGNGFIIKK